MLSSCNETPEFSNWVYSNMPVGVSVRSVTRISSTLVELLLSGNTVVDYDTNLTQFSIVIPGNDFNDFTEAIPAFLTIILMPLTYSISIGLSFGFISYVILKLAMGKVKDISVLMWIIAALSLLNLYLSA